MLLACLRLAALAFLLPIPGLSLAAAAATTDTSASSPTLVIGALSPRPKEKTLAALQPTADYLSTHVQGYRFTILPQLHDASEHLLQDQMEMHRVGNLSP